MPFCSAKLTAAWKSAEYPKEFRHLRLGDHIRAKRLDQGLQIKQLAMKLGADEGSVAAWEEGYRKPDLGRVPAILIFIGYDPRPVPSGIGSRLRHWREGRGMSQQRLAQLMKVDQGTLSRWELGKRAPAGQLLRRALKLLEMQVMYR